MGTTDTAAASAGRDQDPGSDARRPSGSGRIALSVEEVPRLLGHWKSLAYGMVACGEILAIRFDRLLAGPPTAIENTPHAVVPRHGRYAKGGPAHVVTRT